MSVDTSGPDNNTRYPRTLAAAIDKFKKYNLDALIIVNQAPGQTLFSVVQRRLAPMSQDLAGLILPHDHFGTHLNDNGLTEEAELEKENFKLTGDVLAEVWGMHVLDEHSVVAEYINPSPMFDEQLKMVDSTLALDSVIDRYVKLNFENKKFWSFFSIRVCADEEEEIPLDQRVNPTRSAPIIPKVEMKTECDIDE
jgi:hypothetical protein